MTDVPSWCHAGARVVHSRPFPDALKNHFPGNVFPILKQEYTIRSVEVYDIGVALYLREIVNAPRSYMLRGQWTYKEMFFPVQAFSPVKTIEQDMEEHFTALLDAKAPLKVEDE